MFDAMKQYSIIFLDMDGVLNKKVGFYKRDWPQIDVKPLVNLLYLIANVPNPVIVLSSTWRLFQPWRKMKKFLTRHHIPARLIIDRTPYMPYCSRGCEIRAWLRDHPKYPCPGSRIVILDDREDMMELKPYLVQTNPATGLTSQDAERARKLLVPSTSS